MQFEMSLAREQHYHGAARFGGVGGIGNMRQPSTRSKVPEGQLDPEELTRRLMKVLAEQKAHAERKRRAAAAAAAASNSGGHGGESSRSRDRRHHSRQESSSTEQVNNNNNNNNNNKSSSSRHRKSSIPALDTSTAAFSTEYHHIPQEAAKQFARTTTAQQMRSNDFIAQLHKRAATNSHSQKPAENPAEVARQIRHSQSQRDKTLASTSSSQKHTFEAAFSRLQRRHSIPATSSASDDPQHHHHHTANRRSSILALEPHTIQPQPQTIPEDTSPSSPRFSPVEAANEHRAVDWTQSDEARRAQRGTEHAEHPQQLQNKPSNKKLLLSPLLKPASSIWGLRGKIGSKGEGDGGEIKSPKEGGSGGGGFFGRFKR
ncbi:hypothetical protein QBC44DRAFT_81505 [Cladorrhinum sp. PSN332]|nr:hypothetical protein QBC44DRAFT_81505 [Cladorrhinum sp. PSN332]